VNDKQNVLELAIARWGLVPAAEKSVKLDEYTMTLLNGYKKLSGVRADATAISSILRRVLPALVQMLLEQDAAIQHAIAYGAPPPPAPPPPPLRNAEPPTLLEQRHRPPIPPPPSRAGNRQEAQPGSAQEEKMPKFTVKRK